jgi:hypothetical protein
MTNYDKIIRECDSIFGWAKIFGQYLLHVTFQPFNKPFK